jgi:hypothetical protein
MVVPCVCVCACEMCLSLCSTCVQFALRCVVAESRRLASKCMLELMSARGIYTCLCLPRITPLRPQYAPVTLDITLRVHRVPVLHKACVHHHDHHRAVAVGVGQRGAGPLGTLRRWVCHPTNDPCQHRALRCSFLWGTRTKHTGSPSRNSDGQLTRAWSTRTRGKHTDGSRGHAAPRAPLGVEDGQAWVRHQCLLQLQKLLGHKLLLGTPPHTTPHR